MAINIGSVEQMVQDRLPWATDLVLIERLRVEQTYLLQTHYDKPDGDAVDATEDEAGYRPLENMLFADMTAYNLVCRKIMEVQGGDGTAGSKGGAKILKKAEAKPVSAEFMQVKGDDGTMVTVKTKEYLQKLLAQICQRSMALDISNPMCDNQNYDDFVPFKFVDTFPWDDDTKIDETETPIT